MLSSKESHGLGQKKKNSSLWWSRYFSSWEGQVNTYCRCSLHSRGEGGGPKGQRKKIMLKCFLSGLEIQFLFHSFLKFACHVHHLLGALPTHLTFPWVKITWFIPVQEWGAAGQGGSSLPLPHSSASLAPLALVTPECWALRLCGWKQERKKACGGFPASSYCKGLLVWIHLFKGRGGTCIHTHWTYIQAPLKEASWRWQRVLIGKDLGLWSGAKLLVCSNGLKP